MIEGANKPCYAHPKVNGGWVSLGDIFDLYCGEIGKPHELICLYQQSQLIDLEVLQCVRDVNGRTLPNYLGTIFEVFKIEDSDIIFTQYEN